MLTEITYLMILRFFYVSIYNYDTAYIVILNFLDVFPDIYVCLCRCVYLRNKFNFSDVHGAMNVHRE